MPYLLCVVMCSSANVSCVLTCLACQHALRAYVLTCLACSRTLGAYVLACQCILRAHVPTCLACVRAHVLKLQITKKFSMTSFTQIFGIFSLSFSCEIKLYDEQECLLKHLFKNSAVHSCISVTRRKSLTGAIEWFDFL